MRAALVKIFSWVARNHPVIATQFLSLLPFRLHNTWAAQQFLKEMSGSRLTVTTRLNNGMVIKTFIGDEVGNPIYTYGTFESATVGLLKKLLDTKDIVFLDVGAHIGLFTLMAAPLAREVHCFEPMPWVFQVLESNLIANKLKNVVINPIGVRDYSGSAQIWQGPNENTGSGSFLRIEGFYEHSFSVACITLDEYCRNRGLSLKSGKLLIKIDAERSELEVLRGAVALFQFRPTVIIELNDWSTDLEQIVCFFQERNYSLNVISESGLQSFNTIADLFPQRRQSKAINILAAPPVVA